MNGGDKADAIAGISAWTILTLTRLDTIRSCNLFLIAELISFSLVPGINEVFPICSKYVNREQLGKGAHGYGQRKARHAINGFGDHITSFRAWRMCE